MICKFGLALLLVSCTYGFNPFMRVKILIHSDENQELAADLFQAIENDSENSLSSVSSLESYIGPILANSGIDGDSYEYSISQEDKQFLGDFQKSNTDASQVWYSDLFLAPGSFSGNYNDLEAKDQEYGFINSEDENIISEVPEQQINTVPAKGGSYIIGKSSLETDIIDNPYTERNPLVDNSVPSVPTVELTETVYPEDFDTESLNINEEPLRLSDVVSDSSGRASSSESISTEVAPEPSKSLKDIEPSVSDSSGRPSSSESISTEVAPEPSKSLKDIDTSVSNSSGRAPSSESISTEVAPEPSKSLKAIDTSSDFFGEPTNSEATPREPDRVLEIESNSLLSSDPLSTPLIENNKEDSTLETREPEAPSEKPHDEKPIDLQLLAQKAEAELADTVESSPASELTEDIDILQKLLDIMEEIDTVNLSGKTMSQSEIQEMLEDLQTEVDELHRLENLQAAADSANKKLSKAESTDGSEELEEYVELLVEVLDEMVGEDLVEIDGDFYDIGGIQEFIEEIEEEIVEEKAEEKSERLAAVAQEEIDDVDKADDTSEDVEEDIDALEDVVEVLKDYGGSVEINGEEMSYMEIEELVGSLEIELDKQQEIEELEELGDDAQAELNDGRTDYEDDVDSLQVVLYEMEHGDTVEIGDVYYDREGIKDEMERIKQVIEIEENKENKEEADTPVALEGIP